MSLKLIIHSIIYNSNSQMSYYQNIFFKNNKKKLYIKIFNSNFKKYVAQFEWHVPPYI